MDSFYSTTAPRSLSAELVSICLSLSLYSYGGVQGIQVLGCLCSIHHKQQIPRQSPSREKHMRLLRLGEHLWSLKISQVYSNNENKTNLAATRKPLKPHVSSQMCSQAVSAQVRLARLILEVPQTQVSHPAVGAMMQLLPLLSCQTNPAHEALFQLSKEPLPHLLPVAGQTLYLYTPALLSASHTVLSKHLFLTPLVQAPQVFSV